MSISFPGESPEYRAARDRLLKQEVELRRSDPPLLGLGAPLRADRAWARSTPHRFHRPAVESVRLHARGARDRLVSGAELLLTAVVRPGLDATTSLSIPCLILPLSSYYNCGIVLGKGVVI